MVFCAGIFCVFFHWLNAETSTAEPQSGDVSEIERKITKIQAKFTILNCKNLKIHEKSYPHPVAVFICKRQALFAGIKKATSSGLERGGNRVYVSIFLMGRNRELPVWATQ